MIRCQEEHQDYTANPVDFENGSLNDNVCVCVWHGPSILRPHTGLGTVMRHDS